MSFQLFQAGLGSSMEGSKPALHTTLQTGAKHHNS